MHYFRLLLVAFLGLLPAAPSAAQPPTEFATPGTCEQGSLPGGARSLICVPSNGWNKSLVIFAHGYVSPFEPLSFANLTLTDGTSLTDLIQKLGFAFATTTYRQNGLAILEGVDDVTELTKAFAAGQHGPPVRTYVTGVSEGGLVATLAAEQHPELFSAAYATCAPAGNFLFQINYVGDFRVLFDAYFPSLLPGSPIDVPAAVATGWERVYAPKIAAALRSAPERARELFAVARVPHDARDLESLVTSATDLLWYNVTGANDARRKLGGNPYGNRFRWYSGSPNDVSLNMRVSRVDADIRVWAALEQYSPTGDLRVPLVTLHTTADEIVPYAHELLYIARARPVGRGRLLPLPIRRYGHCAFSTSELLTGFAVMLGADRTSMSPLLEGPVAEATGAPAPNVAFLSTPR